MGFSRQECWSRWPFSSPGDLSDPGVEPGSPALQAGCLPSEPPGKPRSHPWVGQKSPHWYNKWHLPCSWGFPDSSVGKESACNAGDPGSIPGSGRFAGEGIGYPLQRFGASLVAQLVKNLPAMHETWVWSLGREDPLEKEMATYSSILAWRIPWAEEPCRLQSVGSQRGRHDWVTNNNKKQQVNMYGGERTRRFPLRCFYFLNKIRSKGTGICYGKEMFEVWRIEKMPFERGEVWVNWGNTVLGWPKSLFRFFCKMV